MCLLAFPLQEKTDISAAFFPPSGELKGLYVPATAPTSTGGRPRHVTRGNEYRYAAAADELLIPAFAVQQLHIQIQAQNIHPTVLQPEVTTAPKHKEAAVYMGSEIHLTHIKKPGK